MSRRMVSTIAAMALVLLVSACGGDKKTDATAAAGAAKTAATAAGKAATVAAAAGNAGVPNAFCGDWGAVAAQSAKLTAPSPGSTAGMKESFDQTSAYMKALADKAPAEIKGDFEGFTKLWTDYSAVMAKANYDMTKMATDPDLQKAMAAMSDPKLQQASVNISTWVQKNCVAGR